MLKKLLRRPLRAAAPMPRIPDGERVYAVGDIHGRLDLLEPLLATIEANDAARPAATTTLVFLGDLVDRGPESAAVVQRLLALKAARPSTRFLQGNHEEIFLGAIAGDAKATRLFCRIGGRETALSYGVGAANYERASFEELSALLERHVPAEHRAFLAGFEDMVTIGDYLFVHAGVDPRQPLDAQRPAELRWIRDRFLQHDAPLAKMVVHGHTISEEVERRPHRIGIDTGAFATGRLSALGLEGDASWVLTSAQ